MSAGSVASPPPRPPSGGSGGGGGLRPPGAESPLDVLSRAAAAASAMVDEDRSNGSDAAAVAAPSSSSSSSSAAPSSSSGGIAAAAEVNGQPKRTGTNFSPSLPFFNKSHENEPMCNFISSFRLVGCERVPSFKERHPKFRKNCTPDYLVAWTLAASAATR